MDRLIMKERLVQLRKVMKREGVDYYLVPTADFHNSEYVNDYFKTREYLSGFSGSSGTLLVGMKEAFLWTDGRYFIQAEKELDPECITLMKMDEEGVKRLEEYLADNLKENQVLAFDGRVMSSSFGGKLEKIAKDKLATISFQKDLADEVWKDRSPFPKGKVMVLKDSVSGLSFQDKILKVRDAMAKQEASAFVLSKLDDIMWLFNIRGCDVECNPVALSHAVITDSEAFLFIQEEVLDKEVRSYLEEKKIHILDYWRISEFLGSKFTDGLVLLDPSNINYANYKTITENYKIVKKSNPTEILKACKNPIELEKMREVYLKDSAVLTKYLYWLKKNVGKQHLTEYTAAKKLDEMRSKEELFLDLSFPTISAYQENAAMCHYDTAEETAKELAPKGVYLVDSGAQYMGGTTDVTRTIALGPVDDIVKKHFTAVACGMLRLSDAKFLHGCSGRNLDILARQDLWERNLDFKHGTGHGIGYILNVHEGPQNIRWKYIETLPEVILEEGMAISNEPGIYIEGSHGIRTENIIVVQKGEKNTYGQFLHFETLTLVPIDKDLLDESEMSAKDKFRLNEYHAIVRKKLTPFLDEMEQEWLIEATSPIY